MPCSPTWRSKQSRPTGGCARRNARWARHGRDDPGTAHHGRPVRRLSGGVPAPGPAAADAGRHPRRAARVPGAPSCPAFCGSASARPLSSGCGTTSPSMARSQASPLPWSASSSISRSGSLCTPGFARSITCAASGCPFDLPVLSSIDPWALLLSAAAMVAIFRFKAGMIQTLLACSAGRHCSLFRRSNPNEPPRPLWDSPVYRAARVCRRLHGGKGVDQ